MGDTDADTVLHNKAGKTLGVPIDLLGRICAAGLLPTTGKHGSWYHLTLPLPARDDVIAAGRELCRRALRNVDDLAEHLMAEIEGIQLDARDAAENFIDPVGYLGDELLTLIDRPRNSSRTIEEGFFRLRLPAMTAESIHDDLAHLDADRIEPLPLRRRRGH